MIPVEQFLYFHGRQPGAGTAGFDIHCTSPGIDRDLLPTLRPYCFFRPLGIGDRPCLARRLTGDGRVIATHKLTQGFDDRYIVHGLIGPAEVLTPSVVAGLALSETWIDADDELPEPGAAFPTADLDSFATTNLPRHDDTEIAQLLAELLRSGQVEVGDDFAHAAGLLASVSAGLLAPERNRLEFVIGEQPKGFGAGRLSSFGRAILPPECLPSEAERRAAVEVTASGRARALQIASVQDERVSYRLLNALGLASEGVPGPSQLLETLSSLDPAERICALSHPAATQGLVDVLRIGSPDLSGRLEALLVDALTIPEPVAIDLGATTAREILATEFRGVPSAHSTRATALMGLVWFVLADMSPRVVPERSGGPPWLQRLLEGIEYGGVRPVQTGDEALPPDVLDLAVDVGVPFDLPSDERYHSIDWWGLPTSQPDRARLCRDPDFGVRGVAWMASSGDWHGELATLLAAEPELDLFLRAIQAGEVPANVVRSVLLARPDLSSERLASVAGGARGALTASLRDLPSLTALIDEELSDRDDGFLGRWRGR